MAAPAGENAPVADAPSTTVESRAAEASTVEASTAESGADAESGPVDAAQNPQGTPVADAPAAACIRLDANGVAVPCEPADAGTPAVADAQPPVEAEQPQDATTSSAAPVDQEGYNPVADPTLPEPAVLPGTYDPWERYNRRMHRINNAVDRRVARPLARAYVRVVPRPIRLGVGNFFNNLGQPVSAVNALLQGRPKQAAQSLGRFALNSTLGIGGIFDPASDAQLPNKSEDFGQTLGVWGWKRSRYVELPLFGPRTLRDSLGMFGDAPLSPLRQVEADRIRIPLQGVQLVDVRAQLLSTDSLREGAEDDYSLVRDAWSQRRAYQIFGDRMSPGDEQLPDYLLDDTNPQVPVGAMPVMPTDGN
ncbi:VacJ family lipoprotein [Lysobacter psychrotolerans]|uniref:VacJ family lipoprotein n=2 Tax=Montanilutibacter psychrotolerans TaxID=1327343 RepID=A0A3M8SZE2_9GAMM|nr:VacJ family lipoprotein [Lysobacter psychrotolerans]